MPDSSVRLPLHPEPHVAIAFPSFPPRVAQPAIEPTLNATPVYNQPLYDFGAQHNVDAFIQDPISFEQDERPFTLKSSHFVDDIQMLSGSPRDYRTPDRQARQHSSKGSSLKKPSAHKSASSSRSMKPSVSFKEPISTESSSRRMKPKKVGGCGSFAFGLLLGLNPLLLIIRMCLGCIRKGRPKRYEWHEHWLFGGETLGLFLLIVGAILVVLVNVDGTKVPN